MAAVDYDSLHEGDTAIKPAKRSTKTNVQFNCSLLFSKYVRMSLAVTRVTITS